MRTAISPGSGSHGQLCGLARPYQHGIAFGLCACVRYWPDRAGWCSGVSLAFIVDLKISNLTVLNIHKERTGRLSTTDIANEFIDLNTN